jgi:DNA processing protein
VLSFAFPFSIGIILEGLQFMHQPLRICRLNEIDPPLTEFQKNFPKILPATEIFFTGSLPRRDRYHLGIVGSRRPSPESHILISELLLLLRDLNLRVVSGGALGVDAQAHHYALKYNLPTYSWVVGDPTLPTPYSNRQIFDEILRAENSSILTPHCLYRSRNDCVHPGFWVERNYWLSANVDALLVVQAKERSGTWSTVKACHVFGIPVYALTGGLTDDCYAGNNSMISKSYAYGVSSLEDLADEIGQNVKKFFNSSEKIVKEPIIGSADMPKRA